MHSTDKIAILMATYNGEKYICQQIDSILSQTCKDWELYIHDDGSTDHTIAAVESYVEKYPDKVHLIDGKSTGGAKYNFFYLFSKVEASYYMTCDQDDVWLEKKIELTYDFSIVPSDYYKANGGVVFPNPNAPTGKLMPLDEIEDIIEHNQDVIVVVDEAYVDFGGESALPLIDKYDNVIVVQTFSKSRSLAGSRVGFAMASPVLIKYLNDVKYSFNSYTMDRITIEAATAAVKDRAYFEETTAKVIKTREWTKKELKRLGFTFCDSKSNFIFAKPANVSATKLFEDLKADNIFVRHFSSPERINDYLRISIGTDEQMHTLIKFLENYSC